jgi:hypothetical protein
VERFHFTNNWEHEEYFVGDKQITPENCTMIEVMWPDGTSSVHEVGWVKIHTFYHDQGRRTDVTRREPHVVLPHRGMSIPINLKKFQMAQVYGPGWPEMTM